MFIGRMIRYVNKVIDGFYNSFILWFRRADVGHNVSIRGKIKIYGNIR